jgi:hypothetical protein
MVGSDLELRSMGRFRDRWYERERERRYWYWQIRELGGMTLGKQVELVEEIRQGNDGMSVETWVEVDRKW